MALRQLSSGLRRRRRPSPRLRVDFYPRPYVPRRARWTHAFASRPVSTRRAPHGRRRVPASASTGSWCRVSRAAPSSAAFSGLVSCKCPLCPPSPRRTARPPGVSPSMCRVMENLPAPAGSARRTCRASGRSSTRTRKSCFLVFSSSMCITQLGAQLRDVQVVLAHLASRKARPSVRASPRPWIDSRPLVVGVPMGPVLTAHQPWTDRQRVKVKFCLAFMRPHPSAHSTGERGRHLPQTVLWSVSSRSGKLGRAPEPFRPDFRERHRLRVIWLVPCFPSNSRLDLCHPFRGFAAGSSPNCRPKICQLGKSEVSSASFPRPGKETDVTPSDHHARSTLLVRRGHDPRRGIRVRLLRRASNGV